MKKLFLLISVAALGFSQTPAGKRIVVHGHRGARAMRPENTLAAFRYALDVGVDALELDLAVTKDNVLVVSHNPEIATGKSAAPGERICNGPHDGMLIHQQTLAEIKQYDCGSHPLKEFPKQTAVPGEKIPTFEEVLDLAQPHKVDLNVETKISPDHPEFAPSPEAFVELILKAVQKRHMESRIILQSFDFRTLHVMKKLAPSIRRAALFSGAGKTFMGIAKESEATILSPAYQIVTPEEVAASHAAGLPVIAWTANGPAEWNRLVEAKVDGIISDDPKALIDWLKAQGKR